MNYFEIEAPCWTRIGIILSWHNFLRIRLLNSKENVRCFVFCKFFYISSFLIYSCIIIYKMFINIFFKIKHLNKTLQCIKQNIFNWVDYMRMKVNKTINIEFYFIKDNIRIYHIFQGLLWQRSQHFFHQIKSSTFLPSTFPVLLFSNLSIPRRQTIRK